MFSKANERLSKDLDVATLVSDKRKNDLLKQLIFTGQERFLMQFSKRAVVASDSESDKDAAVAASRTDWQYIVGRGKQTEKTQEFEQITRSVMNRFCQRP